jgi:hypothetical protein
MKLLGRLQKLEKPTARSPGNGRLPTLAECLPALAALEAEAFGPGDSRADVIGGQARSTSAELTWPRHASFSKDTVNLVKPYFRDINSRRVSPFICQECKWTEEGPQGPRCQQLLFFRVYS